MVSLLVLQECARAFLSPVRLLHGLYLEALYYNVFPWSCVYIVIVRRDNFCQKYLW